MINVAEVILDTRIKAWIYEGVELELALNSLTWENKLQDTSSEDIRYNNRKIQIIQKQLKMVNEKLDSLF